MNNDLISREALKAKVEKMEFDYGLEFAFRRGVLDIIDIAPSVEPKRPQGTWIRREDPRYSYDRENGHIMAGVSFHCSECDGMGDSCDTFCKHCGTPMKLSGTRI